MSLAATGSAAAVQGELEAQDLHSPEGHFGREEPPVTLPTVVRHSLHWALLHTHMYGPGQALDSLVLLVTFLMMHRALGLIIPHGPAPACP